MIVVFCPGGTVYRRNQKPVPCTYEVQYPDAAFTRLVEDARNNGRGGYDCPCCKTFGLKVKAPQ